MKNFGSRQVNEITAVVILSAIALLFSSEACAQKSSRARRGEILMQSDLVTVHYHTQAGAMDVVWKDGHALQGILSAVQLENGRELSSSQYASHELSPANDTEPISPLRSIAPKAHEYTIRSAGPGLPALLQHVWLYDGRPEIVVQAELGADGSSIGTRHFDAVLLHGGVTLQAGKVTGLRVLHVPFDNDMWFRYDSMPVAEMKAGERYSSDEVTAIYDNETRQSLILGSVTHDVWKTAIDVHAASDQLTDVDIYGGISSPTGVSTDTHDTVQHGLVHGSRVLSPAIFIGSFADWREGLEAYGKANAEIHHPLTWPEGAPMGWNSWAAYADKINDRRYLDAASFVRDKLVPQGFGRDKVVYINLDAFWSSLDAVQLSDAVANIKAMRSADGVQFKPGIYWTPFAYWSDDLDAYVEGTGMKYRYRDILLKAPDGSYLPKVDGGRAIDPSHPGTKARTAYYLRQFQNLGFQYLKLDFLSHGTLEGAHYDPQIQTGIEAYNAGMRQIVEENQNRMFLSLSIAPLFPGGYGHARRLSCDTKGHISGGDQSTEYMLNSLTYGWWTDKNLYIADPDHVVLGPKADQGARNQVEGQSRFLSAVISGGMILDSSRLADDPEGQELAVAVYNNRNLFAVASEEKVFRPVEGDTGNKATNVFVRPTARGFYIAAFNFDQDRPQTIHLDLSRISSSMGSAKLVLVRDVASGRTISHVHHDLAIDLEPSASRLMELSPEE